AIEGLSIGSHRGGNRVILIYPLEMLRSDAANTLLKSLEEPPSNTIFILLADRLDRVLPTIRSRCRLIAAPRPDRQTGLQWLEGQVKAIPELKTKSADVESIYDEQGGAPYAVLESLIARHHQDDKDELSIAIAASRFLLQSLAQGKNIHWLDAAEKIQKAKYSVILATMQRWISDLQSVTQSGYPRARRHENHPLATRIQLEALLSQYQQVFED
ncbi:MAG: DNA polymerase III subunit delta', partial [Polynucleobacter sp. 17-46-58]